MSQPRGFPNMQGLVPVVQQPRQPTEAEIAQVEHTRAMQVRRDAIGLAVTAGGGHGIEIGDALADAERIARYIETGEVAAEPPEAT